MVADVTALPKPRAILFDWDNTLVDTWPVIHEALHRTFTALDRTPWTLDEVRARVRRSMRDSFPEVFGPDYEKAADIYQSSYRAIHLQQLKPLNGAVEMLDALRNTAWFLGVVSNKKGPNLRTEIKHLGWEHYFDTIVGADDAARDKPHPDPVELALNGSGLTAGPDVWFIGDSEIDLECAEKTGCTAILYGDLVTEAGHYAGFPFHQHARDHEALAALFKTAA